MMKNSATKLSMVVALAAVSGLVLAGCAGSDGGGDGEQRLRLAFNSSSPEAQDLMRDYADEFHEENPEITIEVETVPQDDLRTKLLTDSQAGTLPDIVTTASLQSAVDMKVLGLWADLSEYMTDEWKAKLDYLPGSFDELGDFGVPWGVQTEGVVFYNPKAFAEAGLEAPPVDEPWTFDEFRDAAQRLTKDGVYGFADRAKGGYTIVKAALPYFLATGNDVIYEKDGEWTSSFELPEVQDALRLYVELTTVDKVKPVDVVSWGTPEAATAYNTGAVRMVNIGDWFASSLDGEFESDWDIMLFPVPDSSYDPSVLVTQNYMNITETSEHKDAAFQFIDYLMDPQRQTDLHHVDKNSAPSTQSALDLPFWSEETPHIGERVTQWLQYGTPLNQHPKYTTLWENVIGPTLQAASLGQMSVEDAITTLNDGINKELAD